ncbi:MAG: formylmethanofuran dehydrogenase subunit C [Planctomycetota bacterium]|nr:MAG: formylmethanofuran dehydrogenase subunit C [Planctomycetota bacterium]
MPLVLRYRGQTSIPVEVEGFLPEVVRGHTLAQIERIEIFHGNQKCALGDFFSVSGSADDACFEFEGDLSGVHWIGAKLAAGEIRIEGSAGRHVGSEMTGGTIHVAGDVSDWVGGEMHGGLIHVRGRAGHFVGAAYRGSKRGMTGGTILVHGPVGDETGHTMRRGLIAVGGAGDFTGLNMIAGTVPVFGPVGTRTGANMRRGTLGLFGEAPVRLLPTFRPGNCDKLLVLQLVFAELRRLGYPFDESLCERAYRMHHGDLVTGGRGEVLVPA